METETEDSLWTTKDVMAFLRRGRTHVSFLCSTGKIPYIPGRPNRFIPEEVKAAMAAMQTGGIYGRRRARR